MKNCLIMGSGRSGTSMVAGILAQAGYFMGDRLYSGRDANPKGFFEDPEINGINEDLLASVVPVRPPLLGRWYFRDRPIRLQRWLARVPTGTPIPCTPEITQRITPLVQHEPFCFKDPRFSYTLPAWRPYLRSTDRDTVYVCVFRHPAATAQSIIKECADAPYLHSLSITFTQALEVWGLMYRHIIDLHRHEGDWLFLHYDQVLSGIGLDKLESHLATSVDRTFPDASLRRSRADRVIPDDTRKVYEKLCDLAEFSDAKVSKGLSR